jgi:hypothetical protein
VAGGAGIAGALYVGAIQTQTLNAASSTASTSTATGALVVSGGVGIVKNLIVGDGISAAGGITFSGLTRVSNTTAASSSSSAALTVAGGAGIAGGLIVGGSVGVGTAPTNAKLEILGSTVAQAEALRLSAGTSSQVGLRLYEDSDHPNFLRIRPISATQKGFIFSNEGDTTVLTVDSANNRVGIGISGPTEVLDVVGNIKASGGITASKLDVGSAGIFTRLSNYGIQTNGDFSMEGGGVFNLNSYGNDNIANLEGSGFEATIRFKDFWTGYLHQGKGPQIGCDGNRFIIRTFDTNRVTITNTGVGISNIWIPSVTTFGWSRVSGNNVTSGFAPLSNGIRAPLINSADGIANQKYSMLVYLTSYNYDPGDSILIRRYDDIPANALLLFTNDSGALYSINGVVQLDGNGVPVAAGDNGWRSMGSVVFYRTT